MPPAHEEQPFLAEILANPADVAPRLIFADWLEDRGDPRAEFIRAQCELAELPADDERAKPLQKRVRELMRLGERFKGQSEQRFVQIWMQAGDTTVGQALPMSVKEFEYRRGFIEQVTMSVRDFLKDRKSLIAAAPIRHLILTSGGSRMRELAACEELRQLEALELNQNRMGDAGLAELTASPHLGNLKSLKVYYNGITSNGAARLANCSNLAKLERLNLFSNEIGDFGLIALARSPWITRLRSLNVGANGITDRGFAELAQSSNAENLLALDFDRSELTDASLLALATSPCLTKLVDFTVSSQIGPEGMWALAGSENARPIRAFNVSGRIADGGLLAVAESACFDSLRILCVRGNSIGDAGAEALADSPRLAQLEKIYFGHNRITFNGVERLMRSEHRTPKLKLYFRENRLSREDQRELHQLFGKSALVF